MPRQYARAPSAEARRWQTLNRCIDKELKRLGIVPPPYDYSGKCRSTGRCEVLSLPGERRRRGEGCSKSEALFDYKVSCIVRSDKDYIRRDWRSRAPDSYSRIQNDYATRVSNYIAKYPNRLTLTWS